MQAIGSIFRGGSACFQFSKRRNKRFLAAALSLQAMASFTTGSETGGAAGAGKGSGATTGSSSAGGIGKGECASENILKLANWNIAAINNNPFEYWISHEDAAYNKMMQDVQEFINNPGEERDVLVSQVFTEHMFEELKGLMNAKGWQGVDQVETMWNENFKSRSIIKSFLKDKELGAKRLASMPDRITNTINLADGSQTFRPTPINCFPGTFESFEDWWKHWKAFMFENKVVVKTEETVVADMLVPIKKAKYPAVTEEEEKISIPLQTLCCAIFDAIMVHMLNHVSPGKWQELRHELSAALNKNKNARTLDILETTYESTDVVFLQEVANAFVSKMKSHPSLNERYVPVVPVTSGKRDQNSIILLRKSTFDISSITDVTPLVSKHFEGKSVPVAEGDVVAATVKRIDSDESFLFASFHGDTNGLATIPVLQAVHDVAQTDLEGKHKLVFGLDANTYEKSKPGKTQDVLEFGQFYLKNGFTSCWGDAPKANEYTTYNARTYLQPQLNKAASREEFLEKGDVNPKDFILWYKKDFELVAESTKKDNTGKQSYIESMAFPTLDFPSDHAVVSTSIKSAL